MVRRGIDDLLIALTGEQTLLAEAQAKADATIAAMIDKRGYSRESARDALMLLRRMRYHE